MNELPIPKVALDLPSGLSSDTGQSLGICLQADLTVTFGLPKVGQVLLPGCRFLGRLFVADIGLSPLFLPGPGKPGGIVGGLSTGILFASKGPGRP